MVVVVDGDVGVDGVPVVAVGNGTDETALVTPFSRQTVTAHQTDGRRVLAKGATAVGEPPTVVPTDDVGRPYVVAEAGDGVVRPLRQMLDERGGLHHPCLAVLRRGPCDAVARGEKEVSAVLVGHHGVVSHQCVGDVGHATEVRTTVLSLYCGECSQAENEEKKLFSHSLVFLKFRWSGRFLSRARAVRRRHSWQSS